MYIRFIFNIGECTYWVSSWGYKASEPDSGIFRAEGGGSLKI